MSENKTQATDVNVDAFLASIEHKQRQADAIQLKAIFKDATGYDPVMWGPSIIGYGRYHYRYASGREGDFLATGYSPRKANLSIYIMPGYADYSDLLKDLGKHKLGKSCLYVNKLADIDVAVLERLIKQGVADLNKIWPVDAT